jgi:hypothetical protein
MGALVATGLIALAVGAGGGYAVGHSKGSDSGKSDGIAQGKAEEAAKYQPGKPSYVAIYDAGRTSGEKRGKREGMAEGKKVGFEQGKKTGIADGEAEGTRSGANAALGGLSGWENGSLYVVTAEDGTDVPTVISARHLMAEGTNYKLCKSDPSRLCESPEQ